AGRVIHHLDPLGPALDHLASLAPVLVVDEFAWDIIDPALEEWYLEQRRRSDASGPESIEQWRWRHPGLHPHDVVLAALRHRYEERTLEWVPYLHRWLGIDVESPDRIGYLWAGARTSTTRSSAPSR
ncbi:MAG TPA: hypothetical protein VKC62_10590, partial [Gaiellaceae bacterium]|nr:hypothetical protein [Gaiellaceae bacterium]